MPSIRCYNLRWMRTAAQTLGRAPTGLTESSTEAEVDAYLSNPSFYPIGMFNDTVDANGDPMKNSPLLWAGADFCLDRTAQIH